MKNSSATRNMCVAFQPWRWGVGVGQGRLPATRHGCPGAGLGSPTQVSSLPVKGISALWPPHPETGPLVTIVDKPRGLLRTPPVGAGERGWHLIEDMHPSSPLLRTLQAASL